jgi:hypothetical protein
LKLEPPLNTGGPDSNPEISADGLVLLFDSDRAGTSGERDIWMVSRPSIDDHWGSPVNLGAPVNGPGFDGRPAVSGDNLILVFDRSHDRTNESTLLMSVRASKDEPFGTPQDLGIVGSSPSLSADGLTLFFMEFIPDPADFDIYVATRATREDAFGTPVPLGPEINTSLSEADPDLSFDGSTLHFVRTDLFRISNPVNSFLRYADLYEAPVVKKSPGDYNADGVVNAADYVVWRRGLSTTHTQNDYDIRRAHFGQTTGSGATLPFTKALTATVPEPATRVLMLCSVLSCCLYRCLPNWKVAM